MQRECLHAVDGPSTQYTYPHSWQHNACLWQRAHHAIEAPLHDAGGPPLPPGISGIAALNSSLGGGVNPNLVNPNVAPVVDPSTVPFQEGWVKIRGIPPGVGKKELCAFFGVSCLSSYLLLVPAALPLSVTQ